MPIKVRPLDDRVVIEPLEAEERTAGGIVLPDTAKEKPQRGRIKAVGPGRLLDNGQRVAISVSEGDEVLFGKYSGTDVELDNGDLKIMRRAIDNGRFRVEANDMGAVRLLQGTSGWVIGPHVNVYNAHTLGMLAELGATRWCAPASIRCCRACAK